LSSLKVQNLQDTEWNFRQMSRNKTVFRLQVEIPKPGLSLRLAAAINIQPLK
jgi:hypothetical protein